MESREAMAVVTVLWWSFGEERSRRLSTELLESASTSRFVVGAIEEEEAEATGAPDLEWVATEPREEPWLLPRLAVPRDFIGKKAI